MNKIKLDEIFMILAIILFFNLFVCLITMTILWETPLWLIKTFIVSLISSVLFGVISSVIFEINNGNK